MQPFNNRERYRQTAGAISIETPMGIVITTAFRPASTLDGESVSHRRIDECLRRRRKIVRRIASFRSCLFEVARQLLRAAL